ncbi:MAG: tRNA adenosine(34) deaminase TadA [Deltaproteobacteria bacterium]|nr:tRNA adenosine(34) deaminase TadA [Deltaproteobacteria bacterium]
MENPDHDRFMAEALALAAQAAREGEVPVGCVVVRGDRIVGRSANRRERLQDPLAHAEMLAIAQAARDIGYWRLDGATLYVTLEPCPMCAGAIVNARIPLVVYGCPDPKAGAARTLYSLLDDPRLNHRCEIVEGVRADECARLLKDFFAGLRDRTPAR